MTCRRSITTSISSTIFNDVEDGGALTYSVSQNTKPDLVGVTISDAGMLSLAFPSGATGTASLEITATDSGGKYSRIPFIVQVIDPNRGNVALGKTVVSSTDESAGYLAPAAVDGLDTTRWSSTYADGQTLTIDLGRVFNVSEVILRWETAFGANYDIQAWDGSAWQNVYTEPNGDGAIDDIALDVPVDTRFIRMNGIKRGTQWGFSLFEFEVYGIPAENADAALETTPSDFTTVAVEATPAPVTASTMLNSFEADTEGWVLADYWAGGKAIDVSSDMASEGAKSLAITASFSGTEWMEAGVYFDPADVQDWSAVTNLAIDVYVPEGATNFLAQIFDKTGDDWTWANTADTPLVPGQWTTVTADLSTLGAAGAVHEYGIKVGTSTTAFDGQILIDNARLITVEAPPAAAAAATVSSENQLNSFEADAEGWVLADYWPSGKSVDVTSDMASDGSSSLAITASFSGTEWNEAGVYFDPADVVDWSAASQLALDVYIPEGADNFLAQIFVKTGDDWTWANTADTPLVAGQWTTVTGDLSTLGDMTKLHEYGIKVGTSTTAFDGQILVDNVRVITVAAAPAAAAVEATASPLASFEGDTNGWVLADYWPSGKSVAVSSDNASDGSDSLAITASFSGTEWNEAGVYFDPAEVQDWSSATQLTMDVYIPEGADNFLAQIFVKTGDDWTWANTADTPLVAGQWNTVTADLSTLGAVGALHEYGIKVGTSTTAFDGQILVDNVRLISPTATASIGGGIAPTTLPVQAEVNAINSVSVLEDNPRLYEKVELVADIDAVFNNPYDPTDIRVDGRFESPSGAVIIVPGFYYREYTQTNGVLTQTDNWSWRVRFTPTEVGEYHYQVLATTLLGTKRSAPGTFTAAASDNPGFIRVDSRNPRYFVFDNGTPYFPVGEDMAWASSNPLTDYPHWLDQLQAAGGNWIRVWMAPWGFSPEWLDTGLGNYEQRQAQSYQLDQLMDMAADRNIYIMLSLLNHGQFSTTTDPEWDQNPYNAANGGPCAEITCFATNPDAIRFWHQRLRYIAARWGYSPNIMTWEWWNEINWSPLSAASLLAPWIENSAAYLRSLDPYHHLITHSGSSRADRSVWDQNTIDFVQDHQYNMSDLERTFNDVISSWLRAYPTKPFLMGEFGSPSTADQQGVLVHEGLWAAPMNGAAGTGMTWWWDTYIDPLNLYYHFKGVSAFFRGEDLAAHQWQPTSADFAESTKARVYGLQADNSALLWVVSRDYSNNYVQQAYNKAIRDALRASNARHLTYSFEDSLDGWALVELVDRWQERRR